MAVALILCSCAEHHETNLLDNTIYTEKNKSIKDTVYSKELVRALKSQALDIMNLYATMTPAKLERYTPSFAIDWMLQQLPNMNKKQVIAHLIESTKEQKIQLNKDIQRLGVRMAQEVKDSIRMFTVNDSLLFANFELSSYYMYKDKKNEALSQIISISSDSGKHWQFIDKDSCREALELEFGKQTSNTIMNK